MITYLLNKYGYECIRKKKNPSLKSHLFNLIDQYLIDIVIDVGANHGQFGSLLRSIGYQGEILSFEPSKKSFEILSKVSSEDERWKIYPLGLGDKRTSEKINIFESSDFNSLLQPSDIGKATFKSKLKKLHSESIDIETLNRVLTPHALKGRRIFLKMDTQGYDLNVFKGASKYYSHIACLLTEISFQPVYQKMPDYHEMMAFYEKKGFSVSGLYPVSRQKDSSVIEMDCFMINTQFKQK
jgi:FkbM family methyltransferase